ncbi:MAG: hypothetical protein M1837_007206 [Sclerophora amabilis]|nr:MAG: hypothetical protein M1837_007206 [Sclerophora amabilis]
MPMKKPRTFSRRIHVLGVGNIGKFVAHSLAGLPHPPPITLILRHASQAKTWEREGEGINIITDGVSDARTGFSIETPAFEAEHERLEQEAEQNPIDHLIVTTKAPHTIRALEPLKHRLHPESSILFLQNGMGIIEEVNESIFPDPEARPNYMLGIISHGVFTKDAYFSAVHAGFGTTAVGALPRETFSRRRDEVKETKLPLPSRYLLRTLTRTPVLAAVGFSHIELAQLQLEKLAINAIINPLTAIMNCLNGDLLNNFAITRTMRLLIAEISYVIRALPELQDVPNVAIRFSPKRLEAIVVGTATKTSNNVSSMLQDTQRGSVTEIDYINGYIVKRGEMLNIRCVMNFMIMQMVKGKSKIEGQKRGDLIPLEEKFGEPRYPRS